MIERCLPRRKQMFCTKDTGSKRGLNDKYIRTAKLQLINTPVTDDPLYNKTIKQNTFAKIH